MYEEILLESDELSGLAKLTAAVKKVRNSAVSAYQQFWESSITIKQEMLPWKDIPLIPILYRDTKQVGSWLFPAKNVLFVGYATQIWVVCCSGGSQKCWPQDQKPPKAK